MTIGSEATIARELARAGERVVILERGRDWRRSRLYGTYPGALLYADKRALLFTEEGMNIIRPLMVGGATSMYCGCSAPPVPRPPPRAHRRGLRPHRRPGAARPAHRLGAQSQDHRRPRPLDDGDQHRRGRDVAALLALPAAGQQWRNSLAWAIFEKARVTPGPLPWEEIGLPLGLVATGSFTGDLFLDRSAVARSGGRPGLLRE